MDIWNKINDMAKTAGDKAGDFTQIGKNSAKIAQENKKVNDELKKIGEFYLKQYKAGFQVDDEILDFLIPILKSQKEIARLEEMNEALKSKF